ncbi:C cytochrome precursor [Stieleria sp. TO1_6]|uniref:multiheme c-type cytochrome n=1 Tax=Stieleria tagensis TaxID=2956795 RepID=UPI00209A7555|nr:multiheme c-type cytochrome [Stieleria tagensis]MCO8122945.1 C cytochrome precursor [Stieleria tagensis]
MDKFIYPGLLVAILLPCAWLVSALPADSHLRTAAQVGSDDRTHDNSAAHLVGKQVCAECHAENFRLHQLSGHADTFTASNAPNVLKRFADKTVDAGQGFGFYHYQPTDQGLVVEHQKRAVNADQAKPLLLTQPAATEPSQLLFPYALGSGRNAITLLALVPDGNKGTDAIEHRVSWFGSHGEFGFTPGHMGHVPASHWEMFGKTQRGEKMQRCVECHTTSGHVANQGIQNLVANVNCEKCHGPGSEHVKQARLSDTPPPYSVGRDDWDHESELQLCGDCHRLPRHVDPKQLRDYSSEMLRLQPIGMLRSECYLESPGKLMCSTCHNPHQDAKTKSEQDYIQDCRNCHQPQHADQVVCPVSPTDGCIECHMPAIVVEQGMVFHDHWIRVRDEP